jgi:hypothetical protein
MPYGYSTLGEVKEDVKVCVCTASAELAHSEFIAPMESVAMRRRRPSRERELSVASSLGFTLPPDT